MTSREIRQKFLDFEREKGHAIIPSASIIPLNDPSLLFVNSGMFPLVPFLLGEPHPEGKRLANSQKCFRAEDIEEVGDERHNTLFEMLGNWSLGDYFKKEQLTSWYEFLVEELHLAPERLYQSIYLGDESLGIPRDEESEKILKSIFAQYGVSSEVGPDTTGKGEIGPDIPVDFTKIRIMAYRDKNWWKRGEAIGELGGPDSETFYDTGKPHDQKFGKYCHLNCDCGRFIEIGNSVFMEYRKMADGWEKIKTRNVDFGGGLERLLMAENGKTNIFETDLFLPIISRLEELSDKKYSDDPRAFEIITDHLKAAAFIMGDEAGIVPSNTGQGYVIRRLIRRAVRYSRQIGITKTGWTALIIPAIQEIYADIYPELSKSGDFISAEFSKEEEKFVKTLEKGMKEFARIVERGIISGKDAFNLYQSYGLPKEDIKELSSQKGISFDESSFDEEFKRHQELSRTASAGMFKGGLADSSEQTTKLHTAAHLVLAALRKVLGDHVVQRGSNITAERLRFDFSHPVKMTGEELKKVEDMVNGWITSAAPVTMEEMDISKAKSEGAMGVFGDRYGEKVKVYSIGKNGEISKEICGGPHIGNIGTLGEFKIIKEESASAGTRRIKAELN
ncbi:MAG: alanine--tRNA ligase [Parcubacteria group bacterium]